MPQRLLQPGHGFALAVTLVCSILIFVSMGVAGASLFLRADSQKEANHQACLAINNLNKVITATLVRSKKNLNHLTYYQEHPQERIQQLYELNRTIAAFKPRTC